MYKKLYITMMITMLVTSCNVLAPTPTEEWTIYKDPTGLFGFPVPNTWIAESVQNYGILTSPNGGVSIYVVVVEVGNIEEAIHSAWTMVDPEFTLEPSEVTEVSAPEGFEELAVFNYATGNENDFVLASGRLYQGMVLTLLIRGESTAVNKHISQIQNIGRGIRVNNMP